MKLPFYRILIMVIPTICFPELSFATREDFLKETLGYRTLRFGELEPEYWLDIWVGPLGRERHFGHSLAFEYGFTERCMMDARATLRSGDTRALIFESGRVELRYRLPQDKSLLADIALSAELSTERTDQGEYEVGIEPRIIFSREVGKLEAPLNLAVEIGLESESPEFNPSFGVRYALLSVIQWGLEARYNATSRKGEMIPQIFLNLTEDMTLKMGLAHGFVAHHADMARLAIEVDL